MKTRVVWSYLTPFLSLLIVVMIGIYASVRAEALNAAFPFACLSGSCWFMSWEAGLFYLVVMLVLTPLVFKQMKSQADRQSETEQLLAETRELVETAPPKQILKYVYGRYIHARNLISVLRQGGNVEDQDVAFAIRVVLRGMLDVAHYWDTHLEEGAQHIYRATVMLINPAEQYAPAEQRILLHTHIRFANRNALSKPDGWNHFDLYLRTESDFNCSNHRDPASADDSIETIILGVKAPQPGEAPRQMVVGAPLSLFYGHPQYIPNTAKIALESAKDPYFEGLTSEIDKFYREDRHAKSILSIPLPLEDVGGWDAMNCPYSAVVNIFRDRVGMFGGSKETSEQYSALMAPFCDMLDQLINTYLEPNE